MMESGMPYDDKAFRAFVNEHRKDDVRQLVLKYGNRKDLDVRETAVQISGYQMACAKLPLWAETQGVVFPPHISMEQCSSQRTAEYKANLIKNIIKDDAPRITDLTAGFGVDATIMARAFDATKLTIVEHLPQLCEIAKHNLPLFGLNDAEVVCDETENVLPMLQHQNLIFIDPARRDSHGGRTYAIADCTPNVALLAPQLLDKADFVMVKLSPMLNISDVEAGLPNITDIHVVSVDGECKELLALMHRDAVGEVRIRTVNIIVNGMSEYSFVRSEERSATCVYATQVLRYIYEPNASLMKAAPFAGLSMRYGVQKLHPDSHLYTSGEFVADFPGRVFEVKYVATFNKKELRQTLKGISRANITVRNFPLTAPQLRAKLHLAEGGEDYIFATTLQPTNQHILVIGRKILVKGEE